MPTEHVVARVVEGSKRGSIRLPPADVEILTHASKPSTTPYIPQPINMKPLPLVTASDDRPSIRDLLAKYSMEIVKLRQLIADDPLFVSSLHDDLWLLRFLLTHEKKGGIASAARAARTTLQFRRKWNLDSEDLRLEWPDSASKVPAYVMFSKYAGNALVHCIPHPDRGIVSFIDVAEFDQQGMINNVSEADALQAHIRFTEWTFQWLDSISRRTGRLTKSTRILDLSRIRFMSMNRQWIKRDGANTKLTEDCYPQLLMAVYPCFAPHWMQAFWRMVRPLMPARFVEKVDMLQPIANPNEAKRLHRAVTAADLPRRFGGDLDIWPPPQGSAQAIERAGLSRAI